MRLISLVEMTSSDICAFSNEQIKELLDKCLYQSTIIRPLAKSDQQRLISFYSRPISLNELKLYGHPVEFDLNGFLSSAIHRFLIHNNELYDLFTQIIVNLFQTQQTLPTEKCQTLKIFIEKQNLGKKRHRLIKEAYENFLKTKINLPSINRTVLNQLLQKILLQDYQVNSNL